MSSQGKLGRLLALLCALLLILSTAAAPAVFALYSMEKSLDIGTVRPARVYFSSDYLRPVDKSGKKYKTATYEIYDWQNGFKIMLLNSSGADVSETDLAYSLTVKGGKHNAGTGTVISLKESSDTILITPTVSAEETVTVTAKLASYDLSLEAKFIMKTPADDESYYSFTDNGVYCTLKVKTGAGITGRTLTVVYGDKLSPVKTADGPEKDWHIGAGSGDLSELKPSTTYTINFIKTQAAEFNGTGDSLIEGDLIILA